MKGGIAAVLALLAAVSAAAAAPATSLRPKERPAALSARQGPVSAGNISHAEALTPARAAPPGPRAAGAQAVLPRAFLSFAAPRASLRPPLRPDRLIEQVMERQKHLREGALCGDIAIQGEPVGRVRGKVKGCGVDKAVRVQSVSGVALSQQAVMTCPTAKALNAWVEGAVKPAFAAHGDLAALRVAAHYVCRTRNNQPGAKISEHGKGRALDISGFQLRDGEIVSVLNGWKTKKYRPALEASLKAACGPFGTVLGPRSNRFHLDHFHLDTAAYRSGPYCR